MTIQQAIEKAVEGGWIQKEGHRGIILPWIYERREEWSNGDVLKETSYSAGYGEGFSDGYFLLDQSFWKCLGKAMGWDTENVCTGLWKEIPEWQFHWHRFIDHLANEGTPEAFFEKL